MHCVQQIPYDRRKTTNAIQRQFTSRSHSQLSLGVARIVRPRPDYSQLLSAYNMVLTCDVYIEWTGSTNHRSVRIHRAVAPGPAGPAMAGPYFLKTRSAQLVQKVVFANTALLSTSVVLRTFLCPPVVFIQIGPL